MIILIYLIFDIKNFEDSSNLNSRSGFDSSDMSKMQRKNRRRTRVELQALQKTIREEVQRDASEDEAEG